MVVITPFEAARFPVNRPGRFPVNRPSDGGDRDLRGGAIPRESRVPVALAEREFGEGDAGALGRRQARQALSASRDSRISSDSMCMAWRTALTKAVPSPGSSSSTTTRPPVVAKTRRVTKTSPLGFVS